MNKKTFLKKAVFSLLGAISGIVSIVFSFVVFGMSNGSFENSKKYGGDAYTGMQNATAQTANNVQDLCELVQTGIGGLLLVVGLALIAYFGSKIYSIYKEEKVVVVEDKKEAVVAEDKDETEANNQEKQD